MSIAPLAPISAPAAALRVQVISAVETGLMAALDAVEVAEATPPADQTRPPTSPPANALRQAVDTARADAAVRQAGAAPLFADLAEAVRAPDLPPAIRAAISQVLALRTVLAAPITTETVRQAVAQSGLFLEARLLNGAAPDEALPPDLKAALLTLQRALAAAPAADTPLAARPATTPPPVREAALSAQPATPPTLSAADGAPVIAQHLAREADQAVARQVLHQLASLPNGVAPAWMFELPVATPQGTGLAQFEIDRDGAQPGSGHPTEAWRVRFSIDIEPLGPVHVHLRMEGEQAAVTIWAEREDGLERLRGQGARLASALPAEVIFHPGAPRRPLPESGQFVDRSW